MSPLRNVTHGLGAVLLSGGIAVAGLGMASGDAFADSTLPLRPGPLPADDNGWGPPKTWCPGDELPATGNHVTDPFRG